MAENQTTVNELQTQPELLCLEGFAEVQATIERCRHQKRGIVAGNYAAFSFLRQDCQARVSNRILLKSDAELMVHFKEDLVARVSCAITLKELNEKLRASGQYFPLGAASLDSDGPGEDSSEQSLMEVLGSNFSGCLEHQFGGPRDLILGLSLITGAGTKIKSGGRVVKNVTGYDTTKLFIGSHAALAIPLEANIRLYALPEFTQSVIFHLASAEEAFQLQSKLRRSGLSISCLEILNKKFLGSTLIGDSRKPYALALRLDGLKIVVEESLKDLHHRIGQTYEPLNTQQASSLWRKVDSLEEYGRYLPISVNAARPLLSQLMAGLEDLALCCRPSRARLQLAFSDLSEQNACLERIRSVASTAGESYSLSCADESLIVKVEKFPQASGAEIWERLKSQFDPDRILNPLLDLC